MKSSGKKKIGNLDLFIKRLFKLEKEAYDVNSLSKLLKLKSKYLILDEEINIFFRDNHNYNNLSISLCREVMHKFVKLELGGYMEWGDGKSQKILNLIKKEIKEKIEVLEKLTPIDQQNKIIQKKMGNFYYLGKPISVGEKTIYYNLLDILLSLSDQDGFLSYKKITSEMKKRLKNGLLNTDVKEINLKSISNAKEYLFQYSKVNEEAFKNKTPNGKEIIQVVRGSGLKINNEDI